MKDVLYLVAMVAIGLLMILHVLQGSG